MHSTRLATSASQANRCNHLRSFRRHSQIATPAVRILTAAPAQMWV
jgi:hypothetical protein